MAIPQNADLSALPTADPSEIEIATEPVPVSTGATAHGAPRPDLDGLRVKFSNRPHIYIIMDGGYRRHIPNPTTYNNLFRSWSGVVVDNDIDEITESRPLQSGAVLVRGHQAPHVYLIDHGRKRHVTSPAAMDKYHFAWNRVTVIPQSSVDAIPDGPAIS
jgi:hypothetical protein